MTEPEALDALKRAAVEWESHSGEPGAPYDGLLPLLRAARTYARTVRPHDQD